MLDRLWTIDISYPSIITAFSKTRSNETSCLFTGETTVSLRQKNVKNSVSEIQSQNTARRPEWSVCGWMWM